MFRRNRGGRAVTYRLIFARVYTGKYIHILSSEKIDAATDVEAVIQAEAAIDVSIAWRLGNVAILRDETGNVIWRCDLTVH